MRLLLVVLCLSCASAQEGGVQLIVTHQPLEVWKGAFLAKAPGLGLYEVMVCNMSIADTIRVDTNLVRARINEEIPVVRGALIESVVARTRRSSKLYKVMRIVEWTAWVGGMLTAGGTVAASKSVMVIFPILAAGSDKLASQFEDRGLTSPLIESEFLAAGQKMDIEPRSCQAKLFIGAYRSKNPEVLKLQLF